MRFTRGYASPQQYCRAQVAPSPYGGKPTIFRLPLFTLWIGWLLGKMIEVHTVIQSPIVCQLPWGLGNPHSLYRLVAR
jgi:hypothetical protein